jgi:hypothetical protein
LTSSTMDWISARMDGATPDGVTEPDAAAFSPVDLRAQPPIGRVFRF